MERRSERAGERMTYERLSELTGLARPTLEAIGSRQDYNPTLLTIEKLCVALECGVEELLQLQHAPPS